jgi:proton-translocating NADH-quinone oxidoreductase chain N
MNSVLLFLPELAMLALILLLFGVILAKPLGKPSLAFLPWVAAGVAVIAASSLGFRGTLFWDAYRVDGLSQFFKLSIAVGYLVAVLNALGQPRLAGLEDEKRADYFLFLSLSAWGLMLLSSGAELVTIYVALEISSYSLFALVPLRGQSNEAAEAGIKYILFGAAATAISLYGISYIAATQHSTYLADLVAGDSGWGLLSNIGLVMFMAGFFYKLALFPFHFWSPDVYQGASNETTAFIATLPKLGAVVVLVRLATLLQPGMVPSDFLAFVAAASMTYGNLAALAQSDLKRLLGYSGIAHAGYVILGIIAGTPLGLAAAAFYSLVYILMNLTCFWVICRIAEDGRNVTVDDLDGLYRRMPALAFTLGVAAFALVGLPPTAGFMGKLFLFSAVWGRGYDWLVIVAALNTAISIYYYLNLVRHAYTRDPAAEAPALSGVGRFWPGLLAASVLLLGVLPGPVFDLAVRAGQELMP